MTTLVPDGGIDRAPWWRSPSGYVALLLCSAPVYDLVLALAPEGILVAGIHPAVLAILAMSVAAVAAWVPAVRGGEWVRAAKAWFVLAIVMWLYLIVLESRRGETLQSAAVLLPLGLALLWAKPPGREQARRAVDVFAWLVVGGAAVALVLQIVGAIPTWYSTLGPAFDGLKAWDASYHWLPLGQALGIEARWGGFARDPNIMGPFGAFLVVYGFGRRGRAGWAFAAAGLLIVLLCDARGSYVAMAAGLTVLLLLPGWGTRITALTGAKVAALAVIVGVGLRLGRDILRDAPGVVGMSGRSDAWPAFLDLWRESPALGVGSDAIRRAVEQGRLPEWSYHAHNQHLDTLVRFGAAGLVLSLAVFACVVVVAVSAARRGDGLPAALLTVLAMVTLVHIAFDWRYPNTGLSELLVVLVLAGTVATAIPARPKPVGQPS